MNRYQSMALVAVIFAGLVGCAHDKNKAEKLNTSLKYAEPVTGNEKIGVKNGDLVVQKKVLMSEELRDLQNKVYSEQDRVYGNRDYGSEGLWGALKKCRAKLVSPSMGGDGHLMWTEPRDLVVHSDNDYTIGLDDHNRVIGLSEEYLKDRISRFRQYKAILDKREDQLQTKLQVCDTELSAAIWKRKHKKNSGN